MEKTILTLASACALATSAHAGPSYNEIIGEWIHPDWGSAMIDGDGVALSLSYSPAEHFYLAASGNRANMNSVADVSLNPVFDISQYTVGIGGYFALISEKLHIAADVGGVWQDIEGFGNDNGLYLSPHLRWSPQQVVEVRVGALFSDLDVNEDWAFYGRVFFEIFEAVDFTASYTGNDDYDTVSAGLRIRF